jgi:ABC-type transporter Mla MlaB component
MQLNYSLPNSLNKSNVLACLKEIQAQAHTPKLELNIDCANVLNIDSAGIALLLELTTLNKFHHPLKLINLSASIHELCALYQINL